MKNILFQKIPTNESRTPLISIEAVSRIHTYCREALPDDYILLTTPLDLSKVDGDAKIINIDCKTYSANELLDIIEKANMYDDLCD
jgi:hypothetical protein